jgi:hypothetical protein
MQVNLWRNLNKMRRQEKNEATGEKRRLRQERAFLKVTEPLVLAVS